MNDVRPRWVHYRSGTGCTLVVLGADGRVGSLMGQRSECQHSAYPMHATWHDFDECASVAPAPPQALDFATAFAAMQAGETVRSSRPDGSRWRIRDQVFQAALDPQHRPNTFSFAGPSVAAIAGPWYLDDGKREA